MRRALSIVAALAVALADCLPAWSAYRPRYGSAPETAGEEDTDSQTRRRKRSPQPEDEIDTDARPRQRSRIAPPPDVKPGERDEIDPDAERNPCDGTATDLTELLGAALNRVAMRKADGRDFKNFRKRRERQQKKFPDAPGYAMLSKVVVPAERELVRGYNGLVEKGLVPLAAAGVYIDDAIAELRDVSEQGSRVMEDIDSVTAELERIVESFDADNLSGGGTANLSALQAHERELPRIKERIKNVKDQICRADVLVRAAAEGPRLGLKHAVKARELAEEADKRDAEAIDRATRDRSSSRALKSVGEAAKLESEAMNCTTGDCPSQLGRQGSSLSKPRRSTKKTTGGCPTGDCGSKPKLESIEGRSGPVIEDAAAKLECASEQTEVARKNTDLVSNPTEGKLMRAATALERAAEIAMYAAGDGIPGGGKGGRGARGCGSCGASCGSTTGFLNGARRRWAEMSPAEREAVKAELAAKIAKTRESLAQTKDEVKAAQSAADSAKSKLESAARSWEGTVQNGLGVRDEKTLDAKLPLLPEPNADIHAPRTGGPQTRDAQAAPKPQHAGESDDSEGVIDWKSHQKYRRLTGQGDEE